MSRPPLPPAPPAPPPAASNRSDWIDDCLIPVERDQLTDSDCSICHGKLFQRPADGEDWERAVRSAQCGHVFGQTCIIKWAMSNAASRNTCPSCRTRLFEVEPEGGSSDEDEGGPRVDNLVGGADDSEEEDDDNELFPASIVGTLTEHWQDWRDRTLPQRQAVAESIVQGGRDGIRQALNDYLDRVIYVRGMQLTGSEQLTEEVSRIVRNRWEFQEAQGFIGLTLTARTVRDAQGNPRAAKELGRDAEHDLFCLMDSGWELTLQQHAAPTENE